MSVVALHYELAHVALGNQAVDFGEEVFAGNFHLFDEGLPTGLVVIGHESLLSEPGTP
jgi:hypothetical protein